MGAAKSVAGEIVLDRPIGTVCDILVTCTHTHAHCLMLSHHQWGAVPYPNLKYRLGGSTVHTLPDPADDE